MMKFNLCSSILFTLVPAILSAYEAGERQIMVLDGVSYAWRWIPEGTFTMGEALDIPNQCVNEVSHKATLTQGFWMLETEVTQKMWQSIMGKTVVEERDQRDPSLPLRGVGDSYPINYIDWNESDHFCQILSQRTGKTILLPTEAQWERACRAGEPPFNSSREATWYMEFLSDGSAHEVGLKKPNPWGLYDMYGNLWEWCRDWYQIDSSADTPSDPLGPETGTEKVLKGGGWSSSGWFCRPQVRTPRAPEFRDGSVGFRIISLDPPEEGSLPLSSSL